MATRSLGSLTLDLVAKTGSFEQGMDRAARTADKRMKEIEASAKRFGAVIGTALVTGAALVANELRRTINQMDELSKAAQRANMPVEDFTKLAYAADLADVSLQDLQSSFGRLAKAQADAEKSTSQQARLFDALGIATRDAQGKLRTTQDVFLEFADAFQRHRGSPEILAAGMQIFGRSFQTLIPLLKDGAQGLREAGEEAEALGLVFGDEAGAQAEKFNDDLTRLKSAMRGLWIQVTQQVLPDLIRLTDQFVTAAKDGDTLKNTADAIATALRGIADAASLFGRLISSLEKVRDTLSSIEEFGRKINPNNWIGDKVRSVLPDWMYSAIGGAGQPTATTPAPGRETDFTLGAPLSQAEIEAQARKLRNALGDAQKGSKAGGGKSDAEREAERLQRAYESLGASMRERIALFNTEGEAAKVAYQIQNEDLSKLDATTRAYVQTLQQKALADAQQYDAMVKLREENKARMDAAAEESDRINRGLQAGKELLSDLQFELELMKMTNAERATAIQLRGLEAEAVARYGDEIAEANRKIEESTKQIQLMDGMRDSFATFFEDVVTGAKSIKDAFKDMFDNIARMITQRIAENWVEQLFGEFGTNQGGSVGRGWFPALAGLFGGGMASGGRAMPHTMYEVNERGIEMATVRGRDYLLTGGSPVEITPNHRLSTNGGGVSVVNNFNRPVDPRTSQQLSLEIAQKTRFATARDS